MLGFPLLYPKGMRIMMFQLSGFYCRRVLGFARARRFKVRCFGFTHRPQSSSFLGLPYRILKHEPQKGTTLGLMGRGLEVRRFRVQRFRGSEVQWFRSLGLGIYRR